MTHDGRLRAPRASWLVALPLVALAVISFVFVREQAGEGQIYVTHQQQAQTLTPAAVARVVRVAPDPVTRKPGRSATCGPRGSGVLQNPWNCTISYASGRRIEYSVAIRADGSYVGGDELVQYRGRRSRDTGTIQGCCVSIP